MLMLSNRHIDQNFRYVETGLSRVGVGASFVGK